MHYHLGMPIASLLTSEQKHMVLKTLLSSEGSEEPAHLHSLVRTFALEVEEDSGQILDFKLNFMHKNRPLKEGFAHTFTLYVILKYQNLVFWSICLWAVVRSVQGPSWPRILRRSDFSLQEN